MKIKYLEKIDGLVIVRFLGFAATDGEATKAKIKPLITPEMAASDIKNLIMDNLVYAKVGPEGELIDDQTAEQIQEKLDNAGPNQLLLNTGEYIANYRGVEYWINKSGKWVLEKIEKIGIQLPEDAILLKDLSAEQQREIYEQKEAVRIAGLTPDEKEKEKNIQLHSIARQANQKAEDAELLEEKFDKAEWFASRKNEIEKKYA